MTVTEIAVRRKNRVALTLIPPPPANLEGAEYEGEKLLIDKTILLRCNLEKGSELNHQDLNQLVFVSQCYRAKQRAIWLLSGQDYSEKGLYEKLLKSFTPKAAAFAVKQMIERGFVNDKNFAALLVKRCKEKNLSKRQIFQKLIKNGISKEISDSLLKDDDLVNTDFERALTLIKTKYAKKVNTKEDRQKTFAALMRRGFTVDDIKKALARFDDDSFDEEIY